MKKLSFLLIVLFVLVGCTSTAKKIPVPKEVAQETSAPPKNEVYKLPTIPDLTVEDVPKALAPLGLIFKAKKDAPFLRYMFLWRYEAEIKKGDNEIDVTCLIMGYSENEIVSISIIAKEMDPDFEKIESFNAEALEILRYAAKIPIKDMPTDKIEEWIEYTLKYFAALNKNNLEKGEFPDKPKEQITLNNIKYTIEDLGTLGLSKEITVSAEPKSR